MWVHIVRQIRLFLKKWFWNKPTEETPQKKTDTEIKAKEVMHAWTCVKYNDQDIALRKSEIPSWNNASRKRKRQIAHDTAMAVKKGRLKFIEIDGKMTCVKNRDYATRVKRNAK